jgi:hypothetical protein
MSKTDRDYQRSKLYAWEQEFVKPHDKSHVAFKDIKGIVDWIWAKEGLQYPPLVGLMDARNHAGGDATRIEVRFHDHGSPTWIIIHEVAHSMTATAHENHQSVGHGPSFVGVYMRLLEKYMGLNLLVLMATAKNKGVDFDIMASPAFLD